MMHMIYWIITCIDGKLDQWIQCISHEKAGLSGHSCLHEQTECCLQQVLTGDLPRYKVLPPFYCAGHRTQKVAQLSCCGM